MDRKIVHALGRFLVVPARYDADRITDEDYVQDSDIQRLTQERAGELYAEASNLGEADDQTEDFGGMLLVEEAYSTDQVTVYCDGEVYYIVATDGAGELAGVVCLS